MVFGAGLSVEPVQVESHTANVQVLMVCSSSMLVETTSISCMWAVALCRGACCAEAEGIRLEDAGVDGLSGCLVDVEQVDSGRVHYALSHPVLGARRYEGVVRRWE